MESKAKIVLQIVTDAEQAKKQAKEIGSKVTKNIEKGSKKITFGQKIKQNLDKIKVGVENIGIGGDKLSKLGQLFKGGGWIAVAAAGVTLIAKGAMALWDKMTLTSEEAIARAEKLKQYAEQDLTKSFEDQNHLKAYAERLQEINKQQVLTNAERLQSIMIIDQLSKVYGDLGLSISTATGKVLNFDQALEKMQKKSQSTKIKSAESVLQQSKVIANENLKGYFDEWFWESTGKQLHFFGKSVDEKRKNAYLDTEATTENKLVKNVNIDLTDQEKKLRQKYNESLQGKIDYFRELQKSVKQEQTKQQYDKIIKSLQQVQKAEKDLQAIKKHGFKTDQDYIDHLKAQSAQLRNIVKMNKDRAKKFAENATKKQQEQFYNNLTPISTKIAYSEYLHRKNGQKLQGEQFAIRQQQKRVDSANSLYQQWMNKKDKNTFELQKRYKGLYAETKKLDDMQKKHLQGKQKQLNLQQQIRKLKKQSADQEFQSIKTDQKKYQILQKRLKANEQLYKKQSAEYDESNKKILQLSDKKLEAKENIKNKGEEFYIAQQRLRNHLVKNGLPDDSYGSLAQYRKLLDDYDKAYMSGDSEMLKSVEKQLKNFKTPSKQQISDVLKKMNYNDYTQYTKRSQDYYKKQDQFFNERKRYLDIDKQIKSETEKNGKLQDKKTKQFMLQLQIKAEMEKIQKRAKEYYTDVKKNLDHQLQYQQLLLQGRYEQAQRLKIINELKQQGLKIDQKEVEEIQKRQKALADLKINDDIKKQGESILDRFAKKDKKYQYQKRIKDLQKANGKSLTEQQKKKVKTLVDIQFNLQEIQKIKPNLSDFQIKTNELTARGGFVNGAVVPDIVSVSNQIRDYQAKSSTLLAQIKNILQNGGVI